MVAVRASNKAGYIPVNPTGLSSVNEGLIPRRAQRSKVDRDGRLVGFDFAQCRMLGIYGSNLRQ